MLNLKKVLPNAKVLNKLVMVDSIEQGAELFGNATKFDGQQFSNLEGEGIVYISKTDNIMQIVVPLNLHENKTFSNEKIVRNVVMDLSKIFLIAEIKVMPQVNCWKLDNGLIKYENANVIQISLNREIDTSDIMVVEDIAESIKHKLHMKEIGININEAMVLV